MAKPLNLANQWVLVTGASSGLGSEIARQLAAQHQSNLILLARSTEKLHALKAQLEAEYRVSCVVVTADLSKPESFSNSMNTILSRPVYAAVLNAGVTHFDLDVMQNWQEFETLLHTNVSSIVYFTRTLIKHFEQHNLDGGIVLVGSMAGLVPVPYQASYSGSKAFLSHWAMALQQELSKKAYSLSLFAPGGIDTEMNSKSGLDTYFKDSFFIQSVESCASDALETLIKRKPLLVPRVSNRLQVLLVKLMPRILTNRVTAATYRKAWLTKNNQTT